MTQNEIPATQMVVDPRFMPVADLFFRMFFSPGQGGGALACYLDGECVLASSHRR